VVRRSGSPNQGTCRRTATKEIIVRSAGWASDEAFARQAEIMKPVFESADAREGAQAFAQKRAPVWRGE
jgi:enoyl-CoA hydratase